MKVKKSLSLSQLTTNTDKCSNQLNTKEKSKKLIRLAKNGEMVRKLKDNLIKKLKEEDDLSDEVTINGKKTMREYHVTHEAAKFSKYNAHIILPGSCIESYRPRWHS